MKSIRDTIIEIVSEDLQVYSVVGTVTNISGGFADIEPLDGSAELQDVRIIADDSATFKATPKVGSVVICTFLDNDNAFISQLSEVDKYTIANSSESLKTILKDLISAIRTATWATPAGNTLAPPINDTQFTSISNSIDNLFD